MLVDYRVEDRQQLAYARGERHASSGSSASSVSERTRPTPGIALQEVVLRLPDGTRLDRRPQLAVHVRQPAPEPAQMLRDVAPHRPARTAEAVGRGRAHLDALPAPGEQRVEPPRGSAATAVWTDPPGA